MYIMASFYNENCLHDSFVLLFIRTAVLWVEVADNKGQYISDNAV